MSKPGPSWLAPLLPDVAPRRLLCAASVAYADSTGEPGACVANGDFFTFVDAAQFVATQASVYAATREREYFAVRIVCGGGSGSNTSVLGITGTAAEISALVRRALSDTADGSSDLYVAPSKSTPEHEPAGQGTQ